MDRISLAGTDIMSFKFTRRDDQQQDNYLDYKAGQYAVMDLGTKEDPEGPVRSFTIASSPTEEEYILISTRIRDTPFKKKLANLDLDTQVKFTAPLGKFTLPEENSRSAVFLSGGIGVTPFRSMIKYATDKKSSIKILMCDSNRNKENILYKKEFDECMKTNKNLRIVYTITGEGQGGSSSFNAAADDWKGESGHIDKAMVNRYLTSDELDNSIFYICGPPGMLRAMQQLLQVDLLIPKERIKIEEFTGY